MKFIEKIVSLMSSYPEKECGMMDQGRLYGKCEELLTAKHVIFLPMPDSVQKSLVADFKRPFPPELLEIYRFMNGGDLFTKPLQIQGYKISDIHFSIYGVPLTYDRKHLEPFYIRIEDGDRREKVPKTWLKFGSYKHEKYKDKIGLFVDTDSMKAHSAVHDRTCNKTTILESWKTIDDCLCSVVSYLEEHD